MRDIKFRAWNSNTNRFELSGDLWLISGFITGSIDKGSSAFLKFQQYTGLRDKNGVEIYEGDIVDYRGMNYPVVWNDGASKIGEHDDKWGDHLGWYLYRKTEVEGCYDEWLEVTSDTIYEVIGNIWENKELLR